MTGEDKVVEFCKLIGGTLSEPHRKTLTTEEANSLFKSGGTKIMPGSTCYFGPMNNTKLHGDSEYARVDLKQQGFDFIIHVDDIICAPNNKDCSIIGENMNDCKVHALIHKDRGIDQVTVDCEKNNTIRPLLAVYL